MNPGIQECDLREAGKISAANRLLRSVSGFRKWPAMTITATMVCLSSRAATHYVTTVGALFDPPQLAIRVNDTVVWIQNDIPEHTVTSDDNLFNSGNLDYGDEYSLTFDSEGEYPYYCLYHGHGMSGVIVVSDAAENESPTTPVNQSPADNTVNQPVAVQLRGSIFSDPDDLDFHAASQWVLRYASNNVVALDSGEVTGSGNLTNYSPVGLSEGTSYDWQVRYKDGRGAWSDYSTPTRFTTLVAFNQHGVGLRASYNNIIDFVSPLIVVTNASVDFNWGKTRPNRRITADEFAVRWEGSLLPQFTEQYQIQFQFHGSARVWVNNQLLIDEWNGCAFPQTRRGLVSLVAGQLVAVRIEYVADAAGALATLHWASPSLPMEVIPMTRLFPFSP